MATTNKIENTRHKRTLAKVQTLHLNHDVTRLAQTNQAITFYFVITMHNNSHKHIQDQYFN